MGGRKRQLFFKRIGLNRLLFGDAPLLPRAMRIRARHKLHRMDDQRCLTSMLIHMAPKEREEVIGDLTIPQAVEQAYPSLWSKF